MYLSEKSLPYLVPIFDELHRANFNIDVARHAVEQLIENVPCFEEFLVRRLSQRDPIVLLDYRHQVERMIAMMLRNFSATAVDPSRLHLVLNNICHTAVEMVTSSIIGDFNEEDEAEKSYLDIFVPSPDSRRKGVLHPGPDGVLLFTLSKLQKKILHPLWELRGKCMHPERLQELVYGPEGIGSPKFDTLKSTLNHRKLYRNSLAIVNVSNEGYALRRK